MEYFALSNGLKVVLSPDSTVPLVNVTVYYHVGFRHEPQGRTGFAHLFEHLMFQGSENLDKMEFAHLVLERGGTLNGATRLDFTKYFSEMPSHELETVLWAEADRMRGLEIDQEILENQQGVVKSEVKNEVLDKAYGGFPWLDIPRVAFSNWHNAHNFYGELADIEAATLEEASAFFADYYGPNNAVLVIAGDFETADARGWVERYFGPVPAANLAQKPDTSETPQTSERRGSKVDPLAPTPALAVAYAMPERDSEAYLVMGLLDEILLQGSDSLLHEELVQKRGLTSWVSGGVNSPLGTLYEVEGPVLWTASLHHDAEHQADDILRVIESVIASLRERPVDQATLERAQVQMRSVFLDQLSDLTERADLLACFALFFDDPGRINRIDGRLRAITPEKAQRVAQQYLKPEQRSVFEVHVGPKDAGKNKEAKDDHRR
ncbi:MAG: pitrilysin family protein [Acidobacteriota bacterium]